jgi:hypothetical protein
MFQADVRVAATAANTANNSQHATPVASVRRFASAVVDKPINGFVSSSPNIDYHSDPDFWLKSESDCSTVDTDVLLAFDYSD